MTDRNASHRRNPPSVAAALRPAVAAALAHGRRAERAAGEAAPGLDPLGTVAARVSDSVRAVHLSGSDE